jgi:peptide/nickel transport system permease protein
VRRGVIHALLAPFLARPIALVGVAVLIVVIVAAAFAPWLAPYDPQAMDPVGRLSPPDAVHWFGTDQFGRDTLSRTIHSARKALVVGVGVDVFALLTGVPIGVFSALFPRLGNVLMRAVDVLMAFPSLLLALGLIVILGPSVLNSIIAVGAGFLTTTTRIVYGLTLRLRSETYVEAARSMGSRTGWLVSRHILPNLVSPLLVQASFVFAFAQLAAASLDFLGVGAPPDIPSWGNMLAESRQFITRAPWLLFFPGMMIVLSALSLNLVGDTLRDRLDPRFRAVMGGES